MSVRPVELLVQGRALPPLLGSVSWECRRRELLELLATEIYGATPATLPMSVTETSTQDDAWAGKATLRQVEFALETPNGLRHFPVAYLLPHSTHPAPLIVALTFGAYPAGRDLPMEEVLDSGWAIAVVHYEAITRDAPGPDHEGLISGFDSDPSPMGAIGTWAYAASRVFDHASLLPEVDSRRIVAAGHSRLGKTALWAVAQDERFAGVIANNSGCTGAALSRGKSGEQIAQITTTFPHWFTERYPAWADRETELPLDQHFLLAAAAPRPLYLSSAADDAWADPVSEFLGAVAASPAWEVHGFPGLLHHGTIPRTGTVLHDGTIGYHLRAGAHFHSREDWRLGLSFMSRHLTPS